MIIIYLKDQKKIRIISYLLLLILFSCKVDSDKKVIKKISKDFTIQSPMEVWTNIPAFFNVSTNIEEDNIIYREWNFNGRIIHSNENSISYTFPSSGRQSISLTIAIKINGTIRKKTKNKTLWVNHPITSNNLNYTYNDSVVIEPYLQKPSIQEYLVESEKSIQPEESIKNPPLEQFSIDMIPDAPKSEIKDTIYAIEIPIDSTQEGIDFLQNIPFAPRVN